jgi:hypothetical protein
VFTQRPKHLIIGGQNKKVPGRSHEKLNSFPATLAKHLTQAQRISLTSRSWFKLTILNVACVGCKLSKLLCCEQRCEKKSFVWLTFRVDGKRGAEIRRFVLVEEIPRFTWGLSFCRKMAGNSFRNPKLGTTVTILTCCAV